MANWMESLGLSYTLVNVNVNQLNMYSNYLLPGI